MEAAHVTNFESAWRDMEITSGGPGSSAGCCCGVTLGVHGSRGDGEGFVYAKTEDWGPQGGKSKGFARYICDDSGNNHPLFGKCNPNPQRASITPGQPVHLTWQVEQNVPSAGHVTYTGNVNGVPIKVVDPRSWDNKVIWPGVYHSTSCKATDPTRVRVDGAGTNVKFGQGLMVTPLS